MSEKWSPGQCVNCKGFETADVRANSGCAQVFGAMAVVLALFLGATVLGCFIGAVFGIVGLLLLILGRPTYARVCRNCGHQIQIAFPHRAPLSFHIQGYVTAFNELTFEQKFWLVMGLAGLGIGGMVTYLVLNK